MHKFRPSVFLGIIIVLVGMSSQVAFANSHSVKQMVVVLADRTAISEANGGIDLFSSLIGLISSLHDGQHFVFISTDDPLNFIGPTVAGDVDFNAFTEEISAKLKSPEPIEGNNLVAAIIETFNFMSGERAPAGSIVYFVAGGESNADLDVALGHLGPALSFYNDAGWPIIGLTLPGISPEYKRFVDRVSTDSGGDIFRIDVPHGLKSLADKILRDQAKGSLSSLGDGVLSSGDVLTSILTVAPGTREATLLFFKERQYGSLRLSNPEGFEASSGDRKSSSVLETPHIVIWKLVDPVPGQWTIDIRGIDGEISAWHYADNKYQVRFESLGAVPIGEPSPIIASITDGGDRVALEGVAITARVTHPSGAILTYELNDDGVDGDATAGDGFYSTMIAPVSDVGSYAVDLQLVWPEFGHSISSQGQFDTQAFPSIQVTSVGDADIAPGKRSKVATLVVNVQGLPYSVATDEVSLAVASNTDQTPTIDLIPLEVTGEGRAWKYDVYYSAPTESLNTLVFRLNTEYAGRRYSFTSDSMVLSSLLPALPALPAVVTAPPEIPVPPAPPPSVAQVVQPLPTVDPAGFPWGYLAIPIVALLMALGFAVYWLTRTLPFGYLYDDRDQIVADFATVQRHPLLKIFFKNSIKGREIEVQGLEDVSFSFNGDRIEIKSHRVSPTVRLNNQPLVGKQRIEDRAWIGTHGRLYSFFTSPLVVPPGPAVGDD